MKDPFDESGDLVLTDAEVDQVLKNFDETPVPQQRQIVAALIHKLSAAAVELEELRASSACVDDLAMLVRRLVRGIHDPSNDVCIKAMDYLKRKGLMGSILRDES